MTKPRRHFAYEVLLFFPIQGTILLIEVGGVPMTQSNAKKKRLHLQRTSGKDGEKERQTSPFSTHERVTKTKKASIERTFTKYKKHNYFDI